MGPGKRDAKDTFLNRELSWLGFVWRVIAQADDTALPLLERVKFAGIVGMLHDEFFMKRVSGLRRQVEKGSSKLSLDGLTPAEELDACREMLLAQTRALDERFESDLRPALARESLTIWEYAELDDKARRRLRAYFRDAVMPILTPMAVDPAHPFPFIGNLGLNLAVVLPEDARSRRRFVRIEVPVNRPRWVEAGGRPGVVPLEQVIAANLDLMYPETPPEGVYLFRVTRGAEGEPEPLTDTAEEQDDAPGSIIRQVSSELKARRFAGVVRLEVEPETPKKLRRWLARRLDVGADDVYDVQRLIGFADLGSLDAGGRGDLCLPEHRPVDHPRLSALPADRPEAVFGEIRSGDLLLHHPYHSFDTSVLRFLEAAAVDPQVLALKLTIYRTNRDSPIVAALAEAARRGKQVAVVVEITARFDEAPNIAWARYLEREGVHVAYGVERLKTHVKLALVVREEQGTIRRYCHVGTGNYHSGTARIYEDLGVLTARPEVSAEVASVFNLLTGTTPYDESGAMLVAPVNMRQRFVEAIRNEAEHAREGRPSGIDAKMNQLQDAEIIRELYAAGRAGVPIRLNVRGLCCLRPGVPGQSESIRVFSVVGRFLEHSRIYRFENGGDPRYYLGSADWMKRNLNNRVETVLAVLDADLQQELDAVLEAYEADNASAWDCGPDGTYVRRVPAEGDEPRRAQEMLERRAAGRSRQNGPAAISAPGPAAAPVAAARRAP